MLNVLLAAGLAAGPTLERLKAREDQYTRGTLHKDARLLSKVFAADFIDTTTTGIVIRRKEYLDNLRDPSWSLTRIDVWDQQYLLHGDSAVVSAQYRFAGTENGKPIAQHGRATDVWVWMRGDWWCVAAHSSPVRDR